MLEKFRSRLRAKPPQSPSDFADAKIRVIRGASRILHLGGHTGQEANLYHMAGKPVLWVEGDPGQQKKALDGTPPGTRTRNPLIKSQLLCQLS